MEKNSVDEYNKILLRSRYSLCPSGSGPNSIRFWESLAVGSIPILLSDTLELPRHELWDKSIVRLPENELHTLEEVLKNITEEEEKTRRENCLKIYNDLKIKLIEKYNNKIDFKINIPTTLITPYFKVFGHFFGDHLFQLYKIKKWYEKEYNTEVENIVISNYNILI